MYLNKECPYIFVYCFSCRYPVELGPRQLKRIGRPFVRTTRFGQKLRGSFWRVSLPLRVMSSCWCPWGRGSALGNRGFLRWHVCRVNFARKIFFELRKMLRNFPRNFGAFVLWVRKNPGKFPPNFPLNFPNFPAKNQKKFTDELLQERRENGFRSARQMLCGEASRKLLVRFLSMRAVVLGLTELCKRVWKSRPSKPQIIINENNHLALFDNTSLGGDFWWRTLRAIGPCEFL